MRILFFFVLFISFPDLGLSAQIAAPAKLAQSKQWLRLLHYESEWWGGVRSIIESANFFVNSKKGQTDPQAELETFLQQLFAQPADLPEPEALQCRFPARYEFLKEHLQSPSLKWPDRPCPRFDHWFQTLRGDSISLVFSSYYLNNPSSTFGHTLLRINKAASGKDGKRYELLDYGINYAANADKKGNPFTYAFKGLFGGFPGTFTITPYYYKVREYSNSESRDLWEYELNVSQKTVDNLIRHLWEVGPTWARYWYLSENCSYHMFTILEAADPNLDLVSHLKFYVIPTDTVQVAWEIPGFVKSVHFRPSVRTQLYQRAKLLHPDEQQWAADTIRTQKVLPQLNTWPKNRQLLALDTAIDGVDYQYPLEVQIHDSKVSQFKNQLLSARAEIPENSPPLDTPLPAEESPHLGHSSRRWGGGYFSDSYFGNGFHFHYKFAFHDFTDPVVGYPEYAKITFFDVNMNYLQAYQKLDLDQLSLFEVVSLSPYSLFSHAISWRLGVGLESMINQSCTGCHAFYVNGGPGYTVNLSHELRTDLYLGIKALGEFTADANGVITDQQLPRALLGIGPNLTLRSRWTPQWISLLEAWYRKDYQTSYQEFKEVSFATQWNPSKYFGIKGSATQRWFENQESVDLFFYY